MSTYSTGFGGRIGEGSAATGLYYGFVVKDNCIGFFNK